MDHPHIPDIPHNPRGTRDHGCDCDRSYDPLDHSHHHHGHPPFLVDKCADQCDDQLPLFSQVGRGLRGDGYRVEVAKDGLVETILEGLYEDAHTGALTSDWFSENINGGHLYYAYNLRPWTDPQTFTITFRYVRPGRNADEEGTVWSWTTPAIPYLWDNEEKNIGSGVATLYLKKMGEEWDWRQHEKLVYPEGMTHLSMNAPDPLEPYTVNLTYGIGGDIDAPNIDDIAKIVGITPERIRKLVRRPIPTNAESIPDDMNVKEYVDGVLDHVHDDLGFPDGQLAGDGGTGPTNTVRKFINWVADKLMEGINVVSMKPGLLTVKRVNTPRSGDTPPKTEFKLTPKPPIAGPGINVSQDSTGAVTISNTQVADNWVDLEPGVDFDWMVHNWYYFGAAFDDYNYSTYKQPTNPVVTHPKANKSITPNSNPPRVRAMLSYGLDGEIIGAEIMVAGNAGDRGRGTDVQMLNIAKNMLDDVTVPEYSDDDNYTQIGTKTVKAVVLRGAARFADVPTAAIVSIEFKGDYASLNNMKVVSNNSEGTWNLAGKTIPASDSADDTTNWTNVGAVWTMLYTVGKINYDSNPRFDTVLRDARNRKYKKFLILSGAYVNGFNSLTSPHYKIGENEIVQMASRPWLNMTVRFTLMQ